MSPSSREIIDPYHDPPWNYIHLHVTGRALHLSRDEPPSTAPANWKSSLPQLSFRGYRVAVRLHTADGLSSRVRIAPPAPLPPASGCSQLPASHRCSCLCPPLSSSPEISPTWRTLQCRPSGSFEAARFSGGGPHQGKVHVDRPRCMSSAAVCADGSGL